MTSKPLDALRHHVTGAIERGEAVAVVEQRAAAHTLGPWTTDKDSVGIPLRSFDGDGTLQWFTVCGESAVVSDEDIANARLIAAAPDLLAALEIVSNCIPDSTGGTTLGTWEMQKVRAAIRKAKGE